jgi:acyl-CoA thioesterase FadM
MKLIKKDKLQYSLCDANADLSILGAFQLVEDANTEMMGMLKLDGETCLREYGGMWVYVRNHIELRRKIHWMDEYTIECYLSSIGGVKLTIDTIIKTGNYIAVASRTELCALDKETNRIRRANSVGVNENVVAENPETDIVFDNFKCVPSEMIDNIVVHSSDIDFNHHTNNIAYVRYISNQYSIKERIKMPVNAIEIQYVNQTFEGDNLEIYRCSENAFSIQSNGKTVVNCIIKM